MDLEQEPSPNGKDQKPGRNWWPWSDGSGDHHAGGPTLVGSSDLGPPPGSRAEDIWGSPEPAPTPIEELLQGLTQEEFWRSAVGTTPAVRIPRPVGTTTPVVTAPRPAPSPRFVLPDAWAAIPRPSGWRYRWAAWARLNRRTG
jgi:hypothetical protein